MMMSKASWKRFELVLMLERVPAGSLVAEARAFVQSRQRKHLLHFSTMHSTPCGRVRFEGTTCVVWVKSVKDNGAEGGQLFETRSLRSQRIDSASHQRLQFPQFLLSRSFISHGLSLPAALIHRGKALHMRHKQMRYMAGEHTTIPNTSWVADHVSSVLVAADVRDLVRVDRCRERGRRIRQCNLLVNLLAQYRTADTAALVSQLVCTDEEMHTREGSGRKREREGRRGGGGVRFRSRLLLTVIFQRLCELLDLALPHVLNSYRIRKEEEITRKFGIRKVLGLVEGTDGVAVIIKRRRVTE